MNTEGGTENTSKSNELSEYLQQLMKEDSFMSKEHKNLRLSVMKFHRRVEKKQNEYKQANLKNLKRKIVKMAQDPREKKKRFTFSDHPNETNTVYMDKDLLKEPPIDETISGEDAHNENSKRRSCYVCKKIIVDRVGSSFVHPIFNEHCQNCGDINLEKRNCTIDLRGKIALVTGARIKIGYETSLRLLRNGCKVIATSRFPNQMKERFRAEEDSYEWFDRLYTYELDLCYPDKIEEFVDWIEKSFAHLDILINNAAQTIRRPIPYYQILKDKEGSSPNDPLILCGSPSSSTELENDEVTEIVRVDNTISSTSSKDFQPRIVIPELDHLSPQEIATLFPKDCVDMDNDGEPLDLRANNSWSLQAEEVDLREVAEVVIVNFMAPFGLTIQLLPMLKKSPDPIRHVIQVSSMEGKFARIKTSSHVHTNCAKAALNMFVRTSSESFRIDHGVLMNAVDTGWSTQEFARNHPSYDPLFKPPLDFKDGAARILDPILRFLTNQRDGIEEKPFCGQFLKDCFPSFW